MMLRWGILVILDFLGDALLRKEFMLISNFANIFYDFFKNI